jgi:hypothetical protein
MSFAVINMAWVNDTKFTLTFIPQGDPQHGTPPTPNPSQMNPVGEPGNTTTVSASSNSSMSGPGPEGAYQWKIQGTDPTQFINISYNHPYGKGTTWVTIVCPKGFLVQGCGQPPAQSLTLNGNCESLQNHNNAYCQLTVTQVTSS